MTLKQGSGLCILCSIPPMFGELTSSRVQEESREEKGERGRQKGVKGRKIVAGRKRKMERAEEEEGAAGAEARQTPHWEEAQLRAALREPLGLFQASSLWLPAPDHRGQCEADLFGDVFSVGLVCLFSVFLAVDTTVVEKQEAVRGVAGIDNGPQASRAGGILQWGLVGMDAGLLMSVGGASVWVPRTRWPAQAQRWFAPSSLSLSSPPGQERISP